LFENFIIEDKKEKQLPEDSLNLKLCGELYHKEMIDIYIRAADLLTSLQ